MGKIDREYIVREVSKVMEYSMEGHSLCNIIDNTLPLTNWEKQWAKKHLSWKVYDDGGE